MLPLWEHMHRIIGGMLVVLLSFLQVSSCYATTMPGEAKQKLESILSQKEFQPRGHPEGYLDKIMNDLKLWLFKKLQSVKKSLRNFIENLGLDKIEIPFLVRIGEWVSKAIDYIYSALNYILALLIIIIVAILGVLAYRKLKAPKIKSEVIYDRVIKSKVELDNLELNLKGLEQLRIYLREKISNKYKLEDFLTDREVLRSLEVNDKLKEIFSKVAVLSEKVIFAKNESEFDNFEKLLSEAKILKANGSL